MLLMHATQEGNLDSDGGGMAQRSAAMQAWCATALRAEQFRPPPGPENLGHPHGVHAGAFGLSMPPYPAPLGAILFRS